MSEALAVIEADVMHAPANLFGTSDPSAVVARSTEIATALADVLKKKGLAKKISNREFVLVEGWTLLGTMLGVFPVVEWTRPVEDGWEARVEARTLGGQVVGAAEAECLRSESNWKNRDDYALRSMAQTRAVSKALRGPLGFIVQLAGFSPTPAEEIPEEVLSEPEAAERPTSEAVGPTSGSESAPDGVEDKKNARKNLTAALRHAKQHGALPPGHEDWDAYSRWHIKGRYGVDTSKELSAAQTNEFAAYLLEQDIPI